MRSPDLTVDPRRLKTARELAGYTQQQVANKLGVDRSSVGHWESDKRADSPSASNFKTLCKLYGVKPTELLAVSDDKAA